MPGFYKGGKLGIFLCKNQRPAAEYDDNDGFSCFLEFAKHLFLAVRQGGIYPAFGFSTPRGRLSYGCDYKVGIACLSNGSAYERVGGYGKFSIIYTIVFDIIGSLRVGDFAFPGQGFAERFVCRMHLVFRVAV